MADPRNPIGPVLPPHMQGQAPAFQVPQQPQGPNPIERALAALAQRLEQPMQLQQQAAADQTAMGHLVADDIAQWWADPAVQAWAAPFIDNPSRLIGALIAGQNPLAGDRSTAVIDGPTVAEALMNRGVHPALAMGAEFLVPDPTGAGKLGDLVPLLSLLPGVPIALQRLLAREFRGTPTDLAGLPATIFHGIGTDDDLIVDTMRLANYEGHGHSGGFGAIDPEYASDYAGRYAGSGGGVSGPGNVQGYTFMLDNPSVVPDAFTAPGAMRLADFMQTPEYDQAVDQFMVWDQVAHQQRSLREALENPSIYEDVTGYPYPDHISTALRNVSNSPAKVGNVTSGESVGLTELHQAFGFDSHSAIRSAGHNSELAIYHPGQAAALNADTTVGLEQMVRNLRAKGVPDDEIRAALLDEIPSIREVAEEQMAFLDSLAPAGDYASEHPAMIDQDLMEQYITRIMYPERSDPHDWNSLPNVDIYATSRLTPDEVDGIMQRSLGDPASPTLPPTEDLMHFLTGSRRNIYRNDPVATITDLAYAATDEAGLLRMLEENAVGEGFFPYGTTPEGQAALQAVADRVVQTVENNRASFPLSRLGITPSDFRGFDDLTAWGRDIDEQFQLSRFIDQTGNAWGEPLDILGAYASADITALVGKLRDLYPDATPAQMDQLIGEVLNRSVNLGFLTEYTANNYARGAGLPAYTAPTAPQWQRAPGLPRVPRPIIPTDINAFGTSADFMDDLSRRVYKGSNAGGFGAPSGELLNAAKDLVEDPAAFHQNLQRYYQNLDPHDMMVAEAYHFMFRAAGNDPNFLFSYEEMANALDEIEKITGRPTPGFRWMNAFPNRPDFFAPDSGVNRSVQFGGASQDELIAELSRWGRDGDTLLDFYRHNFAATNKVLAAEYMIPESHTQRILEDMAQRAKDGTVSYPMPELGSGGNAGGAFDAMFRNPDPASVTTYQDAVPRIEEMFKGSIMSVYSAALNPSDLATLETTVQAIMPNLSPSERAKAYASLIYQEYYSGRVPQEKMERAIRNVQEFMSLDQP